MTLPIITFLIAFAHRVLSGWQSMALYEDERDRVFGWQSLVLTCLLVAMPWWFVDRAEQHWLNSVMLSLMIVSIFLKMVSFIVKKEFKLLDIHLWENAVTGSFWLYLLLSGHDIIALCCSVYPSLIIHKGLINIGNGLEFFDERTDDATGKTYSIPLLNIKVPRTSFPMRVIFAGTSLFILVMYCMSTLRFSVSII